MSNDFIEDALDKADEEGAPYLVFKGLVGSPRTTIWNNISHVDDLEIFKNHFERFYHEKKEALTGEPPKMDGDEWKQ